LTTTPAASQTILVTGAAGFLGSHLCDHLLAEGAHVIGVDNLVTGNLANIAHLDAEPRFRFVEQDICQPFDLGPIDYVFNFASPASPVDYARLGPETLLVGSAGTINTLELARKYKAGYLHASTSECYGDPEVHPQVETYWGNVNPVGPRSVYDEAKRFSEAAVMAWHRYYGVNTHLVRIFNTYGPRLQSNDGRVISNLVMQACATNHSPSTATAPRPAASASAQTSSRASSCSPGPMSTCPSTSATPSSSPSSSAPSRSSPSPDRSPN